MCLSVVPQKNPTRKELNKFLSYICEGQGCFKGTRCAIPSLQWRHNGRDGVSNHQPLDCLFNRLFRCRSRKHQSSASLAYVRGIHRWPVNSPHKGPVTREMFPIDGAIMFIWYRVVVDNCTVTSHERHIVSNHDHLCYLLNSLFKLTTTKTSKVCCMAFCDGGFPSPSHIASNAESIFMSWRHWWRCNEFINSFITGEFPAKRPMTRNFDVFCDLCLNNRLGKQRCGWWFETPWDKNGCAWKNMNIV